MKTCVRFSRDNHSLVGNLYLPDDYQAGAPLAAVVITGAWTSVKEQMPAVYAAKLSQLGYAALTFDFSGWGESEGSPRFVEDPSQKTKDIHAAVEFLSQRPEVDAKRIAGLGICASAGYMADVASTNPLVKTLALVAPWLHDRTIVDQVYGGETAVNELIALGDKAMQAAEPMLIQAASATNQDSLMYQAPYYTEADRGLIKEYDNQFNLASWSPWLQYDALKSATQLKKPSLMVHSQQAAIPFGAEKYAQLAGSNVELVWIEDATQFDFYDQDFAVNAAIDAAATHLKASL
ncbi:alpha/beta hydrolase [Paraferrimonas sedimenticola]|uniref:Alpha/beta hydrolase n=1 Tax=Paraferrimonas sedimenticola TaxID=375674 RepID=A0AA37RZ43_9GAMM|nr:alpha/beta hydrolase [Paraferrimonas sedimenticola]GLP98031.1 alpha/beta hydrolase [Paraferrimonas sedimenticola]